MTTELRPALRLRASPGALLHPDPELRDYAARLAGPNALELVVEMAHDLRSPLTSIVLLAGALHEARSGPVNDLQRRQLSLIYEAALSLCATATDVLELVSGRKRTADPGPRAFAVPELLRSVRDMILPLAAAKGLEVRLRHPVSEPRVGQELALSRVLLNLTTNALKFTDTGFVELAARPLGPTRVEISVRDTGHGRDPAPVRPEPFPKLPSGLQHHFSSAGLGLAICRKLVRAMGSELRLEPCEGEGGGTRCFFELELPPALAAQDHGGDRRPDETTQSVPWREDATLELAPWERSTRSLVAGGTPRS